MVVLWNGVHLVVGMGNKVRNDAKIHAYKLVILTLLATSNCMRLSDEFSYSIVGGATSGTGNVSTGLDGGACKWLNTKSESPG